MKIHKKKKKYCEVFVKIQKTNIFFFGGGGLGGRVGGGGSGGGVRVDVNEEFKFLVRVGGSGWM